MTFVFCFVLFKTTAFRLYTWLYKCFGGDPVNCLCNIILSGSRVFFYLTHLLQSETVTRKCLKTL